MASHLVPFALSESGEQPIVAVILLSPAFLYIVHIWWFLQLSWLKLINISNFYLNYTDEVEHLKPRIKAIENRLWVFTDNITEFSAEDTSLHFATKLQKQ